MPRKPKRNPEERLIAAVESFAASFRDFVTILRERTEREFPPPREPMNAEIFQVSESEPEEETAAGRFERKFQEATGGKSTS